MIRGALLALVLSVVTSCASIARRHCLEIYCAHVEPVESCEHQADLVPICIEDRLEDYGTFWGWWAAAVDGVVQVGKAVVL